MPGIFHQFDDATPTQDNFLIQAHPASVVYPIILQVDNFYKQTQPTDKPSFFPKRRISGAGAVVQKTDCGCGGKK